MLDNYPTTNAQLAAIQKLHPDRMPDVMICLRDGEGEGAVELSSKDLLQHLFLILIK